MSGKQQWEAGWTCPECKMQRGEDGIDPCLGRLPGVLFACCGHGGKTLGDGYIYFENGTTIRFRRLHEIEKPLGDRLIGGGFRKTYYRP